MPVWWSLLVTLIQEQRIVYASPSGKAAVSHGSQGRAGERRLAQPWALRIYPLSGKTARMRPFMDVQRERCLPGGTCSDVRG